MKALKSKIIYFLVLLATNPEVFAQAQRVRRWSENAVREGQQFGIQLGSAMFVVAAILFMIGSQFAGDLMKKIITGLIVMLGAGGFAAIFSRIIT